MKQKSWWRAIWDGWNNRCPECRHGRIWNAKGQVNQRCSDCGLIFEPDQVDWGGFMWVFTVEGILILVGIVLVELVGHLSFTAHIYLWVAFTILFHVLFYKNVKGQWIALRTMLMGRPDSRI